MSSAPVDRPELAFVAEPRADVVLESSDGHTFPVRRVSLQANSDVFDGMFDAASDSPGSSKDKKTGLPLISLDGTAKGLDVLLRFILPKQVRPDRASLPLETAAEAFRLADKYDFQIVEELALARLETLVDVCPIGVLAVALNQRHLALTRTVLAKLGGSYYSTQGYQDWISDSGFCGQQLRGRVVSGSIHRLSGLPVKTLESLPMSKVRSLFAHEEKVIFDYKSWIDFANTFTFD